MRKINPYIIIIQHLLTLRSHGKINLIDYFVFFIVPMIPAYLAIDGAVSFDSQLYSALISIYAVFAALLLSVQVALFSLFSKRNNTPKDPKLQHLNEVDFSEKRSVIKELNINISYLTIVCIFTLTLCGAGMIFGFSKGYFTIFVVYLCSHSIATMFMVVKRTFIMFHREYD